jgi:hypothetical protein
MNEQGIESLELEEGIDRLEYGASTSRRKSS